ncbi:tripartite tricarboxylate transporter substrate binding protein, partial [Delftia sp. BR1]
MVVAASRIRRIHAPNRRAALAAALLALLALGPGLATPAL